MPEQKSRSMVEDLLGVDLEASSDWVKILKTLLQQEKSVVAESSLLLDPHALVNRQLCLLLADDLLDSSGLIDNEKLAQAKTFFPGNKFVLHPFWQGFELRLDQIARVLSWLGDAHLRKELESISLMQDALIESVIASSVAGLPYRERGRDGLITSSASESGFFAHGKASVRDARVAVLSAWMLYLRQNIGSCFASAPAIVVQQYQPGFFLSDMKQILSKRGVSRVIEGQEFTVPIAQSQGDGAFYEIFSFERLQKAPLVHRLSREILGKKSVSPKILKALFRSCSRVSIARLVWAMICEKKKQPIDTPMKKERDSSVDPLFVQVKRAVAGLSDHPLLKTWEFSLASFSETRQQFCRWNLYIGLGMNRKEQGGIGEFLYEELNRRLEEANRETEQLSQEMDPLRERVNFAASRLNSAHSESQLSWLQADYRNVKAEYESLDQQFIALRSRAQKLAELYNSLFDCYDNLFPKYFQEVYDPDLGGDEAATQYEDRPAGFRLLFKNGTTSLARWQPIYNAQQFIEALTTFFRVSEMEIKDKEEFIGIERDLSEIVTALMLHVRSDRFLQLSFQRLLREKGLNDPPMELHLLENSTTTPWCFVSGGTMDALVSHYYGRLEEASISRFTPYRCDELWVFLIDTIRSLPQWLKDKMDKPPGLPLLMHSGDHAFTLRGSYYPFCQSWNISHGGAEYPYTWIRDEYVAPLADLYSQITLTIEQQKELFCSIIQQWPYFSSQNSPKSIERDLLQRAHFKPLARTEEFAEQVEQLLLTSATNTNQKLVLQAKTSSACWSKLPFIDIDSALSKTEDLCREVLVRFLGKEKGFAKKIFEAFQHNIDKEPFASTIDRQKYWNILLLTLFQLAKAEEIPLINFDKNPVSLQDLLFSFGLGPKAPHIFGDSNWPREQLGFVVNPINKELEVWRVYPGGCHGVAMVHWNLFEKDFTYGVFSNPLQYKLA